MTHEDFVTLKQALILEAIGFNLECEYYYVSKTGVLSRVSPAANYSDCEIFVSAPTIAQVARWMREKHGVDIVVRPRFNSDTGERIGYFWQCPQNTSVNMHARTHKSYESALSDAISTILKPFENYE